VALMGRKVMAAAAAQILGQALTSWGVLVHVAGWPDVSVWVIAPLVAAILVPFRHDGSLRDRATSNFGAAIVVAGIMWWELIEGGLDGILGGAGFTIGPVAMLLLTATVLFTIAGAVFWVLREEFGS